MNPVAAAEHGKSSCPAAAHSRRTSSFFSDPNAPAAAAALVPANDDDDGDDDAPPAADALLEAPSASPSVAPPSTGELASFRQARAAKLAASPFGS